MKLFGVQISFRNRISVVPDDAAHRKNRSNDQGNYTSSSVTKDGDLTSTERLVSRGSTKGKNKSSADSAGSLDEFDVNTSQQGEANDRTTRTITENTTDRRYFSETTRVDKNGDLTSTEKGSHAV